MNRDKQIEKISNEILRWADNADKTGNYHYALSEHLYDNGYRKASEVAEDIIRILRAAGINEHRYPVIAEIKKKYTEGEKNNG